MRGRKDPQATMLAFVDVEARVPLNYPLRTIKTVVDQALAALSPEFDQMYSVVGRPSIPPERVLEILGAYCPLLRSQREGLL